MTDPSLQTPGRAPRWRDHVQSSLRGPARRFHPGPSVSSVVATPATAVASVEQTEGSDPHRLLPDQQDPQRAGRLLGHDSGNPQVVGHHPPLRPPSASDNPRLRRRANDARGCGVDQEPRRCSGRHSAGAEGSTSGGSVAREQSRPVAPRVIEEVVARPDRLLHGEATESPERRMPPRRRWYTYPQPTILMSPARTTLAIRDPRTATAGPSGRTATRETSVVVGQ